MDFPMMPFPGQGTPLPPPPPGLLGALPQIDPQRQGLLAAAFQGLQASGPSRTPVSFGQTLGQAGQAGMQAQRQAQNDQLHQSQLGMQQQMQAIAYQQHIAQLMDSQRKQAAIQQRAAQLPEAERAAFMLDPQGYEGRNKPQVLGRSLVKADGSVIATDQTWQAEQQAAREQKMQELEMRLQDSRLQAADRAALQRELATQRMEGQRQMRELAGAMGGQKPPSGYRFKPDGSLEHIPGGPADPTSKTGPDGMPKLTEAQGKANLYQSRAAEADKIIGELQGKYSPMAINSKNAVGNIWGIGGVAEAAANKMLSKEGQMAEQAQRNFLNAILRQESGAVIGESEFASGKRQYFPQPGDGPDVLKQKAQNRATAIEGLRVMAGPAATMPRTRGASGDFGGDVRSAADAILKGQ